MGAELRILILEDNPADAELARRELEKDGLSFVASVVATRWEFHQQLDVFDPDLILSDYKLPGFDGISAMRMAVAERPEIPFIFVYRYLHTSIKPIFPTSFIYRFQCCDFTTITAVPMPLAVPEIAGAFY